MNQKALLRGLSHRIHPAGLRLSELAQRQIEVLPQLTPMNRMLHHRHMIAVDLADADGRRRQQPIPPQRGSVFAAISRLFDLLPIRTELCVLRIDGNLLLLRLEQMDFQRCGLHQVASTSLA